MLNKRHLPIIFLFATVLLFSLLLAACDDVEPSERRLDVKFDESHKVFQGDSLDSLKPYLEVIYVDEKDEQHPLRDGDYLLSGELLQGNSEVTVSYDDLTEKLTVEVLPQDGTREHPYSVSEAYRLAALLENDEFSAAPVYVEGTISGDVTEGDDGVCFVITDGEHVFTVYDAVLNDDVDPIYTDDVVTVYGYLFCSSYEESENLCGMKFHNEVNVTVVQCYSAADGVKITLKTNRNLIEYSDNTFVYATVTPSEYANRLIFEITSGKDVASLVGTAQTQRSVLPLDEGLVTIVARIGQNFSNPVTVQIIRYDPYTNIGASGFYDNYQPAKDLEDSYWRTKHHLMSGSIDEQYQAPTIAANRPTSGGKFVRNIDENFADNGNSYKVVDYNGNVVNTIYKCGAYVTLEEVAAYVYAWGNIPANYTTDKSGSPQTNAWGKYLRLNNSYFKGDTSRYPYEPVLPDINGGGGSLSYYEIDIGTTGTDCDLSFPCELYNDGSTITRGAARIVYARYDSRNNALSPSERYVFYTYNHYNDFQEYLNYQGGWGEMFGNITGGGVISSEYFYNPTPYVSVVKQSFGTN